MSEWTPVGPDDRAAPLQPRTVLANEVGVVTTEAEDDWLTGAACALDADGSFGLGPDNPTSMALMKLWRDKL